MHGFAFELTIIAAIQLVHMYGQLAQATHMLPHGHGLEEELMQDNHTAKALHVRH